MIHVQNMIHFSQDMMLVIMLTITDDKMKTFSHSTTQHAIEDVKFSFATSISQFIYFKLSYCHKIYQLYEFIEIFMQYSFYKRNK